MASDTGVQIRSTSERRERISFNEGSGMGHYILAGDGSLIFERRATPRVDVSVAVRVAISSVGPLIEGTTTDLSEAGVQVLLPVEVADRTGVDLIFPTFGGSAEVIWSRKEGDQVRLGMKFGRLSALARQEIRTLISKAAACESAATPLRDSRVASVAAGAR